ncbi:MAG: hypothetical protein J5955_01530 [Bacilli bacterium]|nr:hypothetical protein [Bacilli bacterium]
MIREDFNLEYKEFVKQYVTFPICDFTISFTFKGKYYQFDFVNVPKNEDGSTAYDFVSYESGWDSPSKRERFKSLKTAIEQARIEGLTFEEVFNSPESELIDAS